MAIQTRKLYRQNGIIGGVAGGLGVYFDLNPWIFRLLFLLLTPSLLLGALVYAILWSQIPEAH